MFAPRGGSATLNEHAVSSAHSSSPLWLVTNEPAVNELVSYLDTMRRRIEASPDKTHVFEFSRTRLADVRTAFARMIRNGEEQLHKVCELLCETFLDATYTLQSVVIGEVETTRERFTLVQPLVPADLYSHTDLDLGTRQLRRLRYLHQNGLVDSRQRLGFSLGSARGQEFAALHQVDADVLEGW